MLLDELADRLSVAYAKRAKLELDRWQADQLLAERAKALTPENGWPGRNEQARQAAREKALAEDSAYQNALTNRQAAHEKLLGLAGEIDSLEAQRRAAEWRIRERMVELLERNSVAPQRRGDRVEAAFDDLAQAGLDAALEAEAEDAPADVEFPF